jgi:uncharacterized protein (TIGR03437 family)
VRTCNLLVGFLCLGLTAQTLKVTPAALSFTYTLGATVLPAAQTLAVSVQSGNPVNFTVSVSGASWLTVTPGGAKTNATVKASANPTSLAVGSYSGTVVLTPATGTALNMPVTLQVKAPPSTLTVTPATVTVSYTRGGGAVAPVALSLTGNGTLMTFTAAVSGAPWLAASPVSGIMFPAFSTQVTLSIDAANLDPGVYKGTVTINAPSAANKTQTVDVNLTVNPGAPTLTSLFPAGISQGSSATIVTLTGSNFYKGTSVAAGATALAATILGPTSLQATIPASLLATAGNLNLTVNNPNPGGGISAPSAFAVYPPGPRIAGIVNAASYVSGAVAPGEMVSLFGTGLGPDSVTPFAPPASGQPIADSLAGVSVTFGTTPASIIFVSATQVAAMVPYGLTGASVVVTVQYNSASSAAFTVPLASSAPGLFTLGAGGMGQGAVFNINETTGEYTLNAEANPVAKGGVIVLYGTGAGVTTPAGNDGAISTSNTPFTAPVAAVQVNGADATVLYFGPAPGLVDGVFQMNVRLPAIMSAGRGVPLVVTIGGQPSQTGVTIAVK